MNAPEQFFILTAPFEAEVLSADAEDDEGHFLDLPPHTIYGILDLNREAECILASPTDHDRPECYFLCLEGPEDWQFFTFSADYETLAQHLRDQPH